MSTVLEIPYLSPLIIQNISLNELNLRRMEMAEIACWDLANIWFGKLSENKINLLSYLLLVLTVAGSAV